MAYLGLVKADGNYAILLDKEEMEKLCSIMNTQQVESVPGTPDQCQFLKNLWEDLVRLGQDENSVMAEGRDAYSVEIHGGDTFGKGQKFWYLKKLEK